MIPVTAHCPSEQARRRVISFLNPPAAPKSVSFALSLCQNIVLIFVFCFQWFLVLGFGHK